MWIRLTITSKIQRVELARETTSMHTKNPIHPRSVVREVCINQLGQTISAAALLGVKQRAHQLQSRKCKPSEAELCSYTKITSCLIHQGPDSVDCRLNSLIEFAISPNLPSVGKEE